MATDSERMNLIFTQWCEDFRALQNVFWQVPFFAMTITGGLGAAIFAFEGTPDLKRYLLVFIALCNISFILIGWRVRMNMETVLIKILRFEGIDKPKSNFIVLKSFIALYTIVAICTTFAAAFAPDAWLEKPQEAVTSAAPIEDPNQP